jgi:hypothetical protein
MLAETITTKSQQASIAAKQAALSSDQIPTTSSPMYSPQEMPTNGTEFYIQSFASNTETECKKCMITVTATVRTTVTNTIPTYISTPSLSAPAPTTCPDTNNTFYSTFQNGTLQTFRRVCGMKRSFEFLRIPEYFGNAISTSLDGCFDECASLKIATRMPCAAILWSISEGNTTVVDTRAWSCRWDGTHNNLIGGILVALRPFSQG